MDYKFSFYRVYLCGNLFREPDELLSSPPKFHCKPISQKEYEKLNHTNDYFALLFSEVRNEVLTTVGCVFPYHDPWLSSDIRTLLSDCREFIPNGRFLSEFPSASAVSTCGNEQGEDK